MNEDLEAQRITLLAALDAQKTALERNRMGQFATPSPLARELLIHARKLLPRDAKIRFLDPALGSGTFFSALRLVFDSSDIELAQAYELDPHYGQPAEQMWAQHGLHLIHGDFTAQVPESSFNLLICNPPYVRHHHLTGKQKAQLAARTQQVTGLKLSGLAGLYCHFLLQAHAWMAPGAVAGWLIPSEFMDVNYGHLVKNYLLGQVTLLQIHRFDPQDVQFSDALVSSAVVWLKKELPAKEHAVRFSYGGTIAHPQVDKYFSLAELAKEHKWTRFPLQEAREYGVKTTVGDLFKIKRGLATGGNGFFVLNQDQVTSRNIPSVALRPILPSPRHLAEDVILADDQGLPKNIQRLFLLDPRMDEDEIEKKYPELAIYLAEGKVQKLNEGYLCRSRKRWYDQEQRDASPIVCTYLGRGDKKTGRPFRFIRNHSQATVANSFLALYPTKRLQAMLHQHPGLLDEVWRQLNNIRIEDLLGEGRVYGGGLYKLEPKELAKVPLAIDFMDRGEAAFFMQALPELKQTNFVF